MEQQEQQEERENKKSLLNIILAYVVFGALWVLFSDKVMVVLLHDKSLILQVSVLKGWFFVAITASLLYVLMKRNFERVRKINETLREREQRFRFLTEHMVDVIWIADLDTLRFTYVSPSVEGLLGFTPEEMLVQSMDQVLSPDSKKNDGGSYSRACRCVPGRRPCFSHVY